MIFEQSIWILWINDVLFSWWKQEFVVEICVCNFYFVFNSVIKFFYICVHSKGGKNITKKQLTHILAKEQNS